MANQISPAQNAILEAITIDFSREAHSQEISVIRSALEWAEPLK